MSNNYAKVAWDEHQEYLSSPEGRCDALMNEFEIFEKQTQGSLINMRKLVDNIQTEIINPVKNELRKAIEANKYHMEWIEAMKEYYKPSNEDISKINEILMKMGINKSESKN